jgi:hypothetical protein
LACTACSTIGPQGRAQPDIQVVPESGSMNKLSPALRFELRGQKAGDQTGRWLDILIRTAGPIDEAQRNRLEEKGCEIRSIFGDIVTGRALSGNIRDIAGLDFVLHIDKAKKLYPK